jgi:hypothetical protein
MQDFVRDLRETVESATQQMLEIPESQSERRPALGQWSAKEILGHLIDSAANNHRRFVEAQLKEGVIFPGYAQEGWVAVQKYQQASWTELIALWKAYNMHLAHVVSSMPENVLKSQHTLDLTAWQETGEAISVSLEYLVRDYYRHLQEHLRQLFSACAQ